MNKRVFRRLLVGIAASALLVSSASLGADALAVRYYEDAVSRFNQEDWKGAEIQLKNALTRNPTQLSARLLMGRVQLRLGNERAAEEELLMAQNLGADESTVALPLAQARNRLGKYKENLEKLIPTGFPIDLQPDLWVELGTARLMDRDAAGAKIAFNQALRLRPLHSGALVGLARIPLIEEKYQEAEALAEVAVSNSPNSAEAWLIRASALHAQARNSEAAESYARARDLDPGNSAAGLGEATALLDAGKVAKAAAILQDLRNSHPWLAEVPYLQSQALSELGRPAAAREALKAASGLLDALEPRSLSNNPALLKLVGTLATESQQWERAYRAMSLYLNIRSDDIASRKIFARIALQLDKPDDVKRTLVPLVTAGKADAEILALLGDTHARLNDYVVAESYYREALANYRGGPAVLARLGAIQFKQGQRAQALTTLQPIAEGQQATNTPLGVSLFSAMLYLTEGRLDEADAVVEQVMASRPDDLLVLNMRAAISIARGRYDVARQQLDSLVAMSPTFRPARYNLAKLDALEGRYRDAEMSLSRLLAENPNDLRALRQSAQVAVAKGDPRGAVLIYESILQLDPAAVAPASELIELYLSMTRPVDARSVATRLVTAAPASFEAQTMLARVQLAQGQREEAQMTAIGAARMAGYDPRKLMQASRLLRASGAYEEAIGSLIKLRDAAPGSIVAGRLLADTYFRLNDLDKAQGIIGELLSADRDDPEVLALLGDLQMAKGQPKKAAETFAQAFAIHDHPALRVSHYRARTLAGEGTEALADLQAWQSSNRESPMVLRALAERHHQLGNAGLAIPLYERLIELAPDDATTINNFAVLLVESDIERAFRMARRAYELAPENAAIIDTIGWSLTQIGSLEEGIARLRESVARDGRSATTRYHLGVALQEYGSRSEARRQLQQAIKLSQNAAWRADAEARIQLLD